MRTTLTLDDDLAEDLRREAHETGKSIKEVVNLTLRKGFIQGDKPAARQPRFQVRSKACGIRVGVALGRVGHRASSGAALQRLRPMTETWAHRWRGSRSIRKGREA